MAINYYLYYSFYGNCSKINHYYIIKTDSKGNKTSFTIKSHKTAMKFLRILEKKTNKVAELYVNPYDYSICSKSLNARVEV